MIEHANHRLTPHHRLITSPTVLRVLATLLEGYVYAADLQVSVWDFPIELHNLLEAGCSVNTLRWLLRRGYAACSTLEGEESAGAVRSFQDDSQFVLTDAGASLARALPPAMFQAPEGLTREVSSREAKFALPCWNHNPGELSFRGLLVKRFQNVASNQRTILDEFQRRDWSSQIVDPLPPDGGINRKHRLHDTIKNLNRGHLQHLMRFHGADGGQAVGWRGVVTQQSHELGQQSTCAAFPPETLPPPRAQSPRSIK